MEWFWTAMAGGSGWLIVWLATNFVGRPLIRFWELREQVDRQLGFYSNLPDIRIVSKGLGAHQAPEIPPQILQAETTFRDLGMQMRAFGRTQPISVLILRCCKIHPEQGAAGLIGYSNNLRDRGAERAGHRNQIERALKLHP